MLFPRLFYGILTDIFFSFFLSFWRATVLTNGQNIDYLHVHTAHVEKQHQYSSRECGWSSNLERKKYFNVTFITHSCQLFLSIYDEIPFHSCCSISA